MKRIRRIGLWAAVPVVVALLAPVQAQYSSGFSNPYYTSGARIAPSTLVPALRKWYLPQRLYELYGWDTDAYTNYARDNYQRYNDVYLEGVPYYDQYGSYITRGWEVYRWEEDYPVENGSVISKDPRFSSWFNRIVISSSHSGQFHTSLMVGDRIRTSLTPLTFSKPRYDGVQWDFLTDKYSATILTSRASNTGTILNQSGAAGIPADPFTNLYAFRGTAQVGDFSRVGLTYVNAALRSTSLDFGQNSLKGTLSGPLNSDFVRTLIVRISDDSPEDGEGGALLYRWRIFVDGVEHTADIQPIVEGGLRRRGLIEASGTDVISLTFDVENSFTPGAADTVQDFREISQIEVGLVLANDYRVEVTSNRQTDRQGESVFLPVLRAGGNVKDGSNQSYHQFRYGLPTGTRLLGFDVSVEDVAGFSLRAEAVRNYQYRRFPNQNIETSQALATERASAMYATAERRTYPWTVYAEAFSIDANYQTRTYIPSTQGEIFWNSENTSLYEFVDDNDDQDEIEDWARRYFGPEIQNRDGSPINTDDAVFPGLDEDNDAISDLNRNRNRRPDYGEPFLRFEVDPPEYLFGMDMNNNTVIDRFEDDTEADYPYKRGHQGYNAYVGVELIPGANVMAGRFSESLLKTSRQSISNYGLLTFRHQWPVRDLEVWAMENPRLVQDDIPDDIYLWIEEPGTRGASYLVRDPLIAQDTFINTSYLEVRYNQYLPFTTKLKHEWNRQRGAQADTKRNRTYLGLINKAEYPYELQGWQWKPRWKQLYRSLVPSQTFERKERDLTEIFSLMASRPVAGMRVTGGAEFEVFNNLKKTPDPVPAGYTDDSNTWILAAQVSNPSEYLGYYITTNVGVQWLRLDPKGAAPQSEFFSFITIHAGLGTDR
ncbi:MAG: hypothetical protein ABIL09_26800 [Gemmatimonadota bacterium]